MSHRESTSRSRQETEAAPFRSADEVRAFFEQLDADMEPGTPEPAWHEHRRELEASRRKGLPDPT